MLIKRLFSHPADALLSFEQESGGGAGGGGAPASAEPPAPGAVAVPATPPVNDKTWSDDRVTEMLGAQTTKFDAEKAVWAAEKVAYEEKIAAAAGKPTEPKPEETPPTPPAASTTDSPELIKAREDLRVAREAETVAQAALTQKTENELKTGMTLRIHELLAKSHVPSDRRTAAANLLALEADKLFKVTVGDDGKASLVPEDVRHRDHEMVAEWLKTEQPWAVGAMPAGGATGTPSGQRVASGPGRGNEQPPPDLDPIERLEFLEKQDQQAKANRSK